MNLKELDLTVFDRDSLMEMRNNITKELNRRTAIKRNQIKASIQTGDKVKIDHPRLAGKTLIVQKIKIKKADVMEEGAASWHSGWTVPITMLEKI
jgi:hypothetical protein|tara:strand:- start:254 stop:538 length:285 start_codon:yes stop_codon:yes gene_type:complete